MPSKDLPLPRESKSNGEPKQDMVSAEEYKKLLVKYHNANLENILFLIDQGIFFYEDFAPQFEALKKYFKKSAS